MSKINERIDNLEERLKQLKAQQQRIEARRKILVGAVVLAMVDQGVIAESTLRGWLDGALSQADDRALFGL